MKDKLPGLYNTTLTLREIGAAKVFKCNLITNASTEPYNIATARTMHTATMTYFPHQ